MAQTLAWPLNKFEALGAVNPAPPVTHIELADQTISTTGTVFAAQNFGIAGLKHVRCRIRLKVPAAVATQFVLKVSTTSAMTAPDVSYSPTFTPSATTDIVNVDMAGVSVAGFQYAQLSTNLTSTATMDVILEAD